ncbi:class I SAM-dependent methyltransferase [Streptomyces sp. NPDC047987]|uniref:class I SAM-dependent methyltransferase n=1 Tax=unclassified Streptomyces TaxID=2593676 RepID=UPI003412CEB7
MFAQQLALIYDLVYKARGQDFRVESELVTEIVRARHPSAASLLDVGCGTGEHLLTLCRRFGHVEGIDLSEPMVEVARDKLPGTALHVADMRDFSLGRTFDVVISLSTAVAYLPSPRDLATALRQMVRHLAPGGVLIVEPWYFPETFLDGHIAADVVRGDGRTVSRVSHTRRFPGSARVDSHYVVADPHGIEHFTESHVFGLWTQGQYLDALAGAGCTAEYLPDVQSGRGLFVAERGLR